MQGIYSYLLRRDGKKYTQKLLPLITIRNFFVKWKYK